MVLTSSMRTINEGGDAPMPATREPKWWIALKVLFILCFSGFGIVGLTLVISRAFGG